MIRQAHQQKIATTTKSKVGAAEPSPKVGARILYLGRIQGTLIAIKKGMLKYEIAWDSGRSEHYSQREWNKGDFELCGSSTSVVGSAQASLLPDCKLGDLSLSDSVKPMNGALLSSRHSNEIEIGKIYGRLTVREKTEQTKPKLGFLWECECECGSTLLVPSYSLKSGTKKSCGCLRREKSSEIGKSNSRRVEKKCLNCNQTFSLQQGQVLRKKYCSWECRRAYMRNENSPNYGGGEKIKGAANPNWKGGVDYERDLALVRKWRTQVFKRDKYSCTKCGLSKPPHNFLRAHHIAPWSKYPDLRFEVANGITLCADCHTFIHKTFALEEMDAEGRYLEKHIDPCLQLSIFAAGWEACSHWLLYWSEDSKFKLFARKILGARTFSNCDFPQFLFFPTSTTTTHLEKDSSIVSLLQHLVSLSQSKAKDLELTTKETVFPLCSDKSGKFNPYGLSQKTSKAYSLAPTNPEQAGIPILSLSWENSTPAGTMQNGLLSVQDSLGVPSPDKDCFWLESPGALSSLSSRSPGQSRLEAQLKKLGVIQKGECINPIWLEEQFHLPANWANFLESRPATQLLEIDEPPSEIVLTPELQPLHSSESSISTHLSEELAEPKLKRKRSPNFKPASGSISACTSMKKGKPYTSYQYSYDVRDADTRRGWRTAKVGVPKYKVNTVTNLINQGTPILEILEVLKR